MDPSQIVGLLDRCTASEHALEVSKAELARVRASGDRQRAEMAGARVTNASLHKQLAESSSVAAENAAANDKARRDFQNHKRALAEAVDRAKGYKAQAEARQAASLTLQQKNAYLEAQFSRLRGPSGFNLLKEDNVGLRQKLSQLEHEHGHLQQQARAEVDAVKEQARASEAGRVVASERVRRLEARLASLGVDTSDLRQAETVPFQAVLDNPNDAFTSRRAAAALSQKVPRHLLEIEKWFDAIPRRFRTNIPEAKLARHLQSNANEKQVLKNAIAEVQRRTIEVTPLLPRNVRSHILRGPDGWASSPLSPPTLQAMSVSCDSSPEEDMTIITSPALPPAPILATAFAAPGVVPAVPGAAGLYTAGEKCVQGRRL